MIQRLQLILIVALLLFSSLAQAKSLDEYVAIGMTSNLVLQQRRLTVEQSRFALSQARGMFMPTLSLEARYSRAGGGRQIAFPAGDMLNPVYATLNEMMLAQGVAPRFPQDGIANEVIPFMREREHDTKLRMSQPIFVPAILHNYQLKGAMLEAEQARLLGFECQLAAEIRLAYFNWRKATDILDVLETTKHLLEENIRVSKALVAQGKATRDVVFRAEAELAAFEQEERRALMGARLSKNHFNFLLNRPLEADIEVVVAAGRDVEPTDNAQTALSNRQELRALTAAATAAKEGVDLAWSKHLPTLVAALDYGFEGESYRFDGDYDYWMASFVLSWDLFNGLQDHYERRQAEQRVALVAAQRRELEASIALAVKRAREELDVARRGVDSTRARAESEHQSFALVSKRYSLGMAPHIAYLEARDAMTQADIAHVVARHELDIKRTQLAQVLGIR